MRPLRNLALVLLLLASAAFADSIPITAIWLFGNTGGTLTFNPTTETLTLTSTITKLIAPTNKNIGPGIFTGDFGTITVTTGPLISGSILGHAKFNGGTITITTNGTDGLPDGIIFSGTLGSPMNWYELGKSNEFHLGVQGGVGQLMGTPFGLCPGHPTCEYGILNFEQWAILTGPNQFSVIKGITVIPEPGTMVLVATGLGLLACRTKSRHRSIQR